METPREWAFLGGGCFWCLDAVFRDVQGVDGVVSGYMGGDVPDPSYEMVCTGDTGYAEVVRIGFDPSVVSFASLLEIFFTIHDPTQGNRQGNDVGSQYRSVIFWANEAQREIAACMIKELAQEHVFAEPVVTELAAAGAFFAAEDYHQDFFRRNPGQGYCSFVVSPKLNKFRAKFAHLLKQDR
jgi:peptide-methionine (S)-S-oxide reductase